MSDVYIDHGYENRAHYLRCLAEDNGDGIDTVQAVADILGPNEDFDGLVNAIEDQGEWE